MRPSWAGCSVPLHGLGSAGLIARLPGLRGELEEYELLRRDRVAVASGGPHPTPVGIGRACPA